MQPVARRVKFWAADVAGAVEELTLQVGDIDHIEVDDADGADASRGEVQCGWRAKSACTDDEYTSGFEASLAGESDARERQVAAIAE